jgi:hypothetical protein
MIAPWLAWQLWKQRQWRWFQFALMAAMLIAAALAATAWLIHQRLFLDEQKRQLSVGLIIPAGDRTINTGGLADDLRTLAPELVARVELTTDSALAERLQSRYGIPIADLAGDSLLPTVLRVYFNPEQLSRASFTAFVEQCGTIVEPWNVQYPLTKVSAIFQREQELWWIQTAIAIGWLTVSLVIWWLYCRAALPLDRSSRATIELLGASKGLVRRVRLAYAFAATVLGIAIASAIVATTSTLFPNLLPNLWELYARGFAAAGATLVITLVTSWFAEPA